MPNRIERCRMSGSSKLKTILALGEQALTGIFPATREESITVGPLELVLCEDCGLVQLAHSFDPDDMYGENYGYRSGLNASMVRHLTSKIEALEKKSDLVPGDVVLDIGSNDATSLKAFKTPGLTRVGMDPTGNKFRHYYPDDIISKADFFSAKSYWSVVDRPAKLVTSIAMFYDLEDPVAFAREVSSVLRPDGLWHFEQSYLPSMLRTTSYDTICHEHVEYYSLEVIRRILDLADMVVLDVQMNGINGGSFAVTAGRRCGGQRPNEAVIRWLLEQEASMQLHTSQPYDDFRQRVFRHRDDLKRLIDNLCTDGNRVLGYGASTKGNVTLQFCGFGSDQIQAIAEVNPEKFGHYTPGSGIPIISEDEARAMRPDYMLVLPWHFKEGIVAREQAYLAAGGRLIFPFPEIEIV